MVNKAYDTLKRDQFSAGKKCGKTWQIPGHRGRHVIEIGGIIAWIQDADDMTGKFSVSRENLQNI